MICPKCKTEVNDNANFCCKCGAKLREECIYTGYEIHGSQCGRDKKGIFRCVCGKCKALHNDCNNRGDGSHNGSNG